jgi:hypothetical protein
MFLRKVSSMVVVGIAILLVTATAGHAAPQQGGGFAGHSGGVPGHAGGGFAGHAPSGRFEGHPGFQGRRAFGGHRHFDHRFRGGVVFVAPFYWPYYPYVDPGYVDPGYTYQAPAPSYWYYCPSYGAYYPSVQSCPVPWVPVPG